MSDNLGQARGRIIIDTSSVRSAQAEVSQASRAMNQALGAIGVSVGVAGLVQLTKAAAQFAVQSEAIATAYNRQKVAAETLAGGQARLNDLLDTYAAATGGAIDKAQALQDVTKLMAVGFADNAEELDKFARAIRGISIAMGTSQDTVTQNLILELFTQRGARLDQLGLQYDKVKQRANELQAADSSLTQQQAYQNAVLEQAEKRFGALTNSVEGQATGVETLRAAWKNMRLEIGQEIKPNVDEAASDLTKLLNLINKVREANRQRSQEATSRRAREEGGIDPFGSAFNRTSIGRVTPQAFGANGEVVSVEDRTAAQLEFYQRTQEIEQQANRDRIQATQQYEQQRSQVIREYEKSIARDAEDFAVQRARAEEDYATSVQRMRRDIAQREASQAADLERTIADARTDAAERGAERLAELGERIADTRQQSNERLAELEADYNKSRERAEEDHKDRLMKAAGSLDAIALLEERKRFVRQQQDAKENFDDRVAKERKNEANRLEELNKTYAKQTANEQAALDKRIADAQDAYQRQLEDARAADEQRLSDMSEDFVKRLAREDEDRAKRLERLKQDHDEQLGELARQHDLRMGQIDQQVEDEYQKLKTTYDKVFHDLGLQVDGYTAKLALATKNALALFDALYRGTKPQQGPQPQNPLITPGQFPSLNSIAPANSSTTNNTRTSSVSISIYAQPGQDDKALVDAIVRALEGI